MDQRFIIRCATCKEIILSDEAPYKCYGCGRGFCSYACKDKHECSAWPVLFAPWEHDNELVEEDGDELTSTLMDILFRDKKNREMEKKEGKIKCLVCEQVTKASDVRRLARKGEMDQRMVAVVLHHPQQRGKRYRLATDADLRVFEQATAYLKKKLADRRYVENPLSSKILGGEFKEGDSVTVDLVDDALTFTTKVAEAVA